MPLRINPKLLIHNFEYHEYESANEWATPKYKDKVTVKNARIEENVAFCYASDTTPFPEFKRRSKIVTKDGEFIIVKVVKIDEPFKNEPWSVELELIKNRGSLYE